MNHFYIIANVDKDPQYELASSICEYLQERGCEASLQEQLEGNTYNDADPKRIPNGTECVIVLGGDGTLIQAARDLSETRIPVFGVNIGTIGYLTEIDREQIFPALDHLLEGQSDLDERMMLYGEVIRDGKVIYSNVALNDIVLNRVGPLRVIHFDIKVNGEYLMSYPADGLIMATPTGSTAYNLSAGGPIVQPRSNMIIVTPICAHVLNKSSVVFDGNDELEIIMKESKYGEEERAVTFDGSFYFTLQSNDRIIIRKAEKTAVFLHTMKHNFLQILRNKLS